MKNTNWFILEPGQVVSFFYKSQTGDRTSARRTVICLDPRYRYRKQSTGRIVEYFIGLEIDSSLKPTIQPSILKQLFEILGENADLMLDTTGDDTGEQARMKKIYLELKEFLKRYPIFKTYFYRECRKRRVFLEDKYASLNKLQIKQISDNLINENKDSIEDME